MMVALDRQILFLGDNTVIVTENVAGDPYVISVKYMNDIIEDWYGDCCFCPSNDAKVFFAMYNGEPINPYTYTDFESLIRLLQDKMK